MYGNTEPLQSKMRVFGRDDVYYEMEMKIKDD